MTGKSKRLSSSKKIDIVIELLNTNISSRELCRVHNIAPTTLQAWKTRFFEAGKDAMKNGKSASREQMLQKKVDLLTHKIGELTIANDILKKTLEGGRK